MEWRVKLLTEVVDREYLAKVRALLEDNGIPIYVKATGPGVGSQYLPGYMPMKGVWVCLDEQFFDAATLLKDPTHIVSQRVDVAEFYKEAQEPPPSSSSWRYTLILAAIVLTILGVFIAVGLAGGSRSHAQQVIPPDRPLAASRPATGG